MNVIVTGKTSYLGTNLCAFLSFRGIEAHTVSVRNGIQEINFSGTDVVVHCAALVHKNEKKFRDSFKRVNFELAVSVAEKAKREGVGQFVFFSSMSVYGSGVSAVSADTKPEPETLYGVTKLMAENEILMLADSSFVVTIVRPPMVYGRNCPGNYKRLSKLVKTFPFFPFSDNKKSVIYVDNLSFFVFDTIKNKKGGVFMPTDNKAVSTSYMAEIIARAVGKKIFISRFLGKIVVLVSGIPVIKKAFGNLYYNDDCAEKIDYVKFEDAVFETETAEALK